MPYGFVHVRPAEEEPAAEILTAWAVEDVADAYTEGAFSGTYGTSPFYNISSDNGQILGAEDTHLFNDPILVCLVDADTGVPITKSTGKYSVAFKMSLLITNANPNPHWWVVGFGDDTVDQNEFFGFKGVKAGAVAGWYSVDENNTMIDALGVWEIDDNDYDVAESISEVADVYAQLTIDFDTNEVVVGVGIAANDLTETTIAYTPTGDTHLRLQGYMRLGSLYTFGTEAYVTEAEMTTAGFTMPVGASPWTSA